MLARLDVATVDYAFLSASGGFPRHADLVRTRTATRSAIRSSVHHRTQTSTYGGRGQCFDESCGCAGCRSRGRDEAARGKSHGFGGPNGDVQSLGRRREETWAERDARYRLICKHLNCHPRCAVYCWWMQYACDPEYPDPSCATHALRYAQCCAGAERMDKLSRCNQEFDECMVKCLSAALPFCYTLAGCLAAITSCIIYCSVQRAQCLSRDV